jgi:hypothetical protein
VIARIRSLLPSDGTDAIDGSENNVTLRTALELAERGLDDLTDVEVVLRQTDDGWYADLCIDQLHRLPSEVDPILGCREYTALQARAIVKTAQAKLTRQFAGASSPGKMFER